MFSRIYSLFIISFVFVGLAAATPTTTITVTTYAPGATPTTPASQCHVDSLFCCDTAQQANAMSGVVPILLNFMQVAVSPCTALVGADCTSLFAGNSCSAQPVCCENTDYADTLVIGCTPVNINL